MRRPLRAPLLLAMLAGLHTPAALAQPTAVPVSVVAPQPVAVTEELRLTGSLTARHHARLSPRVDGLVVELHADVGRQVDADDVLLELDSELASLGLARAEASVAEARAALVEAERLVEEARPLIADRHLPETELGRRMAEAELARARLAASEAAAAEQAELVRRHTLAAPFAGVIAERMTDVGEWVVRGTPVFELVSTETAWLDVEAPQESFTRIGESAEVEVLADAVPGRAFEGRVAARVPVGDSAARTFRVRIVVAGDGRNVPPGTSATAVIRLTGDRSAFAVPRGALRAYPDGTRSVFVVGTVDGAPVARERRVTVGRVGDEVEVLHGLASGERVIVAGGDALRDGQRVRVQDGS